MSLELGELEARGCVGAGSSFDVLRKARLLESVLLTFHGALQFNIAENLLFTTTESPQEAPFRAPNGDMLVRDCCHSCLSTII